MKSLCCIAIGILLILVAAMPSNAVSQAADDINSAPLPAAQKRIGLALGGGGAKGLCHIAFIKVLDELGLRPSVIAGTSIGAVVGGFYASGVSGSQIEHILKNIKFSDVVKTVDLSMLSNSGLVTGKGIEDFLYEHIPARTFEELKIPLKVVATDFWKRRQVVFDSGELIPAMRASMSMPALFQPITFGGMVLVDGGAVNPLPYDIIRKECDILIAIDVSGEKTPSEGDRVPSIFESIVSTNQIMQESIIRSKMKISKPDIYIKPDLTNIRVLEFHRYDEILNSVGQDVELFRKELLNRIKSHPTNSRN